MNIFNKDKQLAKEEKTIFAFLISCGIIGICIIVLGMINIIPQRIISFGVICFTILVIMIPSLVYRIACNLKENK
jgi:hypothetical protein